MTDLELLKHTLISIGCNFASCNTLIGHTMTVGTESKELDFEFDLEKKFIRVV